MSSVKFQADCFLCTLIFHFRFTQKWLNWSDQDGAWVQSALWLQIHNIFLLRLELHKRFKMLKMFIANILLFFSSSGGFWTLVRGRFSLCLSRHSRLAILKGFCHAVYYLVKNWAKNCLCIHRIPKMLSGMVIAPSWNVFDIYIFDTLREHFLYR